MLPDRVWNPGPLTYESGALLPIALRGPANHYGPNYMPDPEKALSQGYKEIFVLSSAKHEILNAHKYKKKSRNSAF